MQLAEPRETIYAYPNWDIDGVEACQRAIAAPCGAFDGPTAVYIHVPYCVSLCQFCGFTKSDRFSAATLDAYVARLEREMDLVCDQVGVRDQEIVAVYFGGGTASVLSARQVESILKMLDARFRIAVDAERTFEGECRTLAKAGFVEDIARMGFHRLSYGVQTVDRGARLALNLKPSVEALVDLCRRAAPLFENVVVDHIFGWPGQDDDAAVRDVVAICQAIEPPTVESFHFERADASPAFLRGLYALGVRDLSGPEIRTQRRAVAAALAEQGYDERTYTVFSRKGLEIPQHPHSYGQCFYGYDNANVLGFGRGSQSFFGGRMWAFGGTDKEHEDMVASGMVPATVVGSYQDYEREAVTWPRRGWIRAEIIERLAHLGFLDKFAALEAAAYVERVDERFRLTEAGREHVPAVIDFLLPETQRALYQRDFDANEELLRHDPAMATIRLVR